MPNPDTSASCRDCITTKVCNLRHESDERATDLKLQKIDIRLDGMDKALLMRTGELESRLHTLNQLRADVLRDRDLFVRKDIFDSAVAILSTLKKEYTDAHQALINRVTVIETRALTWTAALGIVFTVLQIILHYWRINP